MYLTNSKINCRNRHSHAIFLHIGMKNQTRAFQISKSISLNCQTYFDNWNIYFSKFQNVFDKIAKLSSGVAIPTLSFFTLAWKIRPELHICLFCTFVWLLVDFPQVENIFHLIFVVNLQVSISQVFFEHFNKRNGAVAGEELHQVQRAVLGTHYWNLWDVKVKSLRC